MNGDACYELLHKDYSRTEAGWPGEGIRANKGRGSQVVRLLAYHGNGPVRVR